MDAIRIQRDETISIHTQLVEQLRYLIHSGAWAPGAQLPSVRDLAKALRVNYNTVRAAYLELERQGCLLTEQGRGTFVAPEPLGGARGGQELLLDVIDEALIRAMAGGVSPADFAQAAYARARLFSPAEARLLFAECNRPDMEHYARTIEKETGLRPESFLVEELREKPRRFFEGFDLLVTTLFHVVEMREWAGPQQPVIGLMVEPDYLEVIKEIAALPGDSRVGLVCQSQQGAEAMKRSLKGVGATHLTFLTAGIDQPERLERLFRQADPIFVSRLALARHKGAWPGGKAFRVYIDDLDSGALRLLRREILRIHHRKARPVETSA